MLCSVLCDSKETTLQSANPEGNIAVTPDNQHAKQPYEQLPDLDTSPVSYTHLDVYKRQTLDKWAKSSLQNSSKFTVRIQLCRKQYQRVRQQLIEYQIRRAYTVLPKGRP